MRPVYAKTPVCSVLDLAVHEWLKKSALDVAGDAAQRELHEAADGCLGILAGRNRHRAEDARQAVRKRLRRHAR